MFFLIVCIFVICGNFEFCFMIIGRWFDMKGDEWNWWSEEIFKLFKRKIECLKD